MMSFPLPRTLGLSTPNDAETKHKENVQRAKGECCGLIVERILNLLLQELSPDP